MEGRPPRRTTPEGPTRGGIGPVKPSRVATKRRLRSVSSACTQRIVEQVHSATVVLVPARVRSGAGRTRGTALPEARSPVSSPRRAAGVWRSRRSVGDVAPATCRLGRSPRREEKAHPARAAAPRERRSPARSAATRWPARSRQAREFPQKAPRGTGRDQHRGDPDTGPTERPNLSPL